MHRFHCPRDLAPGARLTLPAEAAHHAIRVLRLKSGDPIGLFDGEGHEFSARITSIEGGTVWVAVEAAATNDREPPLKLVLLQGISSGERMDYTVQKAVELGVAEIWPLLAERSVVRLDRERAEKRRLHWQRVAIAACEQSGRSRVPPVHAPLRLADWLATWRAQRQGNERALLLSPAGGARLAALGEPQGPVILLAGPEGGFTEAEAAAARHQGFLPVRLGPRILRTETAALAALAAIQALWGDF